jgi:hypothetical protein
MGECYRCNRPATGAGFEVRKENGQVSSFGGFSLCSRCTFDFVHWLTPSDRQPDQGQWVERHLDASGFTERVRMVTT